LQVERQTPLPSPHSFCGSLPAALGEHFPARLAWLQDTQVPSHGPSQQTPSTQTPEAQALALEQAVPFLALQPPPAAHACPSAQLPLTSVPGAADAQVPSFPATLHDWHTPEQDAVEQHTPSTQNPEAQVDAVAAVHPSPLARLPTLYSQVSLKAEPSFGPAPNSTMTPRWLSKAMVAVLVYPLGPADSEVGPVARSRRYQVGPLLSSSHVLMAVVEPITPAALVGTTIRRRRLS
jgi:hypothetical protein